MKKKLSFLMRLVMTALLIAIGYFILKGFDWQPLKRALKEFWW